MTMRLYDGFHISIYRNCHDQAAALHNVVVVSFSDATPRHDGAFLLHHVLCSVTHDACLFFASLDQVG